MASFQRAAELQALLEGVALPASRQELIDYVSRQPGGSAFRADLEGLPDDEYESLTDVNEALVRVQPAAAYEPPDPHEESDRPPGGDDYVTAGAVSGAVRDDAPPGNPPQSAIEQQTERQNAQKERQDQLLGE
jgi:Protein of unknown function (DUF2795)